MQQGYILYVSKLADTPHFFGVFYGAVVVSPAQDSPSQTMRCVGTDWCCEAPRIQGKGTYQVAHKSPDRNRPTPSLKDGLDWLLDTYGTTTRKPVGQYVAWTKRGPTNNTSGTSQGFYPILARYRSGGSYRKLGRRVYDTHRPQRCARTVYLHRLPWRSMKGLAVKATNLFSGAITSRIASPFSSPLHLDLTICQATCPTSLQSRNRTLPSHRNMLLMKST